MTELKRIDMSTVDDLDSTIKAVCENMYAGDYKLSSTFVFQTQLVMIPLIRVIQVQQ